MIQQTIDLNLIPESAPIVVHVDQYDIGPSRIVANLYNGDVAYSPSGATVVIQGTKPDHKGFMYNASLSGNKATANLERQMTAVAGLVRTQFVVRESNGRTGTFVFLLDVQPSALADDIDISESDLSIIIEAAETAANSASEAAGSATAAANSASAAKASQTAAANSASAAMTSETNAKTSETNAATSAKSASDDASDAEAWAKGTRDGADVPSTDETYHNNSKYYSEQSDARAIDSEAWAVGTRNGGKVESTDDTYQNNSKYYADESTHQALASKNSASQANVSAQASANSASEAEDYKDDAADLVKDAEAWARGTRGGVDVPSTDDTYQNNSKFYSEQSEASHQSTVTVYNNTLQIQSEINRAIEMAEFSVDDEGYLVYTDVGSYTFTVDAEGYLNWEVA